MADRQEVVQIAQGQDRQQVGPIDRFRGSKYVSAILSGADNYVSGFTILSGVASNIVRTRLENVHVHNRESSHITVVLRDGSISGNVIFGPQKVNPTQGVTVTESELRGLYAVSGLYAVVISGPAYSAGADITVGYVEEPDPTAPGGYLE